MQQAIAGEVEGVDLDLCSLSGVDETDVAVRHHGFDFEMAVVRDNGEQSLCRRYDPAHGVDGKLLDDTSTGAVNSCNLVRCSALIRSSPMPAALRSASASSA